jgi:enterochelin esterase-like enzyme
MNRILYVLLLSCTSSPPGPADDPRSAAALIERFNRESSPVWADGDTATFYFRGEAESVDLIAGGDVKSLERIPSSDVWAVTLTLPELERGILSYSLTARKRGTPAGKPLHQEGTWRGPKAPPQAARSPDLRGSLKTYEIASKALDCRRKLTVYSPPGLEPGQARDVVYTADGEETEHYAPSLEPLFISGKIPPVVLVGVHSGGYAGGAPDFKNYDSKKDMRAQEYFPGLDPERFAKHEAFFCSEVTAWAEREWKVSGEPKHRALFGCSNGGRFVFEMAMRHPDRFGHVVAFSVPGAGEIVLPNGLKTAASFYLEAGTWEKPFLAYTTRLAEALKGAGVKTEFRTRVGGHDAAIWRDELAGALVKAFRPN